MHVSHLLNHYYTKLFQTYNLLENVAHKSIVNLVDRIKGFVDKQIKSIKLQAWTSGGLGLAGGAVTIGGGMINPAIGEVARAVFPSTKDVALNLMRAQETKYQYEAQTYKDHLLTQMEQLKNKYGDYRSKTEDHLTELDRKESTLYKAR